MTFRNILTRPSKKAYIAAAIIAAVLGVTTAFYIANAQEPTITEAPKKLTTTVTKEAPKEPTVVKEEPAPQVQEEAPAPAVVAPKPVVAAPKPAPISIPVNTYPAHLANLPLDEIIDEYGYYNRECVSYVAQKLVQTGRKAPEWWGNANKWYDKAVAAGIGVGTSPIVGSVGVNSSGTYGHTVYVEKVFGNGTIQISQYDGGTGNYSVDTVPVEWFNYIYF